MDVHVLVSSLLCAMAGFPAKLFVLVLTIASFEDGFPTLFPQFLILTSKRCQLLFNDFQEDFYAVVDWAYKIDPLRCISMHGITERYLSGQKADAAGFVRMLLGDLESRISMQFSRVSVCYKQEQSSFLMYYDD